MKFSFVLFALIAAVFVENGKVEAQVTPNYTYMTSLPFGAAAWGRLQHGSGTLYGTRFDIPGSVFSIDKNSYAYGTMHSFVVSDGTRPFAGLAADHGSGASSPFYGTTTSGGLYGYGMVFNVVPSPNSYSDLHDFAGGTDGSQPMAVLARQSTTNYGTTYAGGTYGCGTFFSVDDVVSNPPTYHNLYAFGASGPNDGCGSTTQLQADTLNQIFYWIGATTGGGSHNKGTVFALQVSGTIWSDCVIYNFTGGTDGSSPVDLDVDADGNIYGVAQYDGVNNHGVVFELIPPNSSPCSNPWTYRLLNDFSLSNDGMQPNGIRYYRTTQKLYGTTWGGGANNLGTVFELTAPPGLGKGTETIYHSFSGGTTDGANPPSRPLLDEKCGIIYGTTINGGATSSGGVYRVTGLCLVQNCMC